MKNFPAILLTLLFAAFSSQLFAQDNNTGSHNLAISIPEVALVDIEPANTTISLAPNAPTEAGNFLDFSNARDNSLWLNYSSVVGSKSDPSRKVSVAITNGEVPGGLELYVAAAKAATGKGKLGSPVGRVNLNTTATELISGIGSCYTDNGENFGHQLTYDLQLANDENAVASIDFDESTTLTITYTLTDN